MQTILFLTAYPAEDASCRYRVHQFVPHLERAGYRCTISSFATPQLFQTLKREGRLSAKFRETLGCSFQRFSQIKGVAKFDYIVIHREAFPFFAPVVENWIIRRHDRVIFSFDDAIYAGHENTGELSHPTLYRLKHGRGYDEVIRNSRYVIAGNRILAEYARRHNRNVSVIPTVVDCFKFWFKPPADGGSPITIGWVGSRSTAPYLSLVEPALKRLEEAHPGKIRFRFFGCPDYKPGLTSFESLPFDLAHEVENIHSLDIGLMPLPDTTWTRGKCAFKAIQYMACGVATVSSPVGITPDLIQHNLNGLLARSEDEWFDCLDRLVRDFELRRRIAIEARRIIENEYSLEVWGPRFVELLNRMNPTHNVSEPETIAA